MSSTERSGYTPPQHYEKSRDSRSETRSTQPSRRRRSVSRPRDRRHCRKREAHRSRSRQHTRSLTSSTDTSLRVRSRKQSYQRKKKSSDNSESSTDSTDDDSPRERNPKRRKRRRSRTTLSWSSSAESVGSRTRSHRYKHKTDKKKRKLQSPSCHDSYVLKKLARMFGKTDHHFEGAQNVIPEFNPDANVQSAASWIRKVNETAKIYKWSEKQIIFYAIPKLAGQAKKWYQGRTTVNLSWREWQKKIIKTFPDDRNYADRLQEMLDRRSRREESLEDYFHDKARLVKMCGVTGRNSVDCIINGIYDHNIRLNAQGSSFKRPSQLLKYLRRISKKNMALRKPNQINQNNNRDLTPQLKSQKPYNRPREHNKSIQCYNCLEIGHTSRTCSKPIKRCEKCSRVGHDSQKCETISNFREQNNMKNKDDRTNATTKTEATQNVLKISSDGQTNGKYFKSISLNNSKRSAYVDFGSQCTLISKRVADECHLDLIKTGLPLIKGFAFGSIVPLGRAKVRITVDAVEADVDAYIVDDHLLETDILIGQSLTELPTVVVHKTSSSLMLYCDETEAEKVHLQVVRDVILKAGLNNIEVQMSSNLSGPFFVPGNLCMKPGREHVLLQGVYQFTNGKGQVLVVNLSNQCLNFKCNTLMSRVIKLPNECVVLPSSGSLEVNVLTSGDRQMSCPPKEKPPITLDMLNIGSKATDSDKTRLLQIVNSFRDCFALDTEELGVTHVTEMSIKLNDSTPVTYKPYRLPFSERSKVREIIGDLIANGIVQESQSAYASPIVLVRKPNNELRLCVDYRALNKKTIKDSYPMPVIEDQLDRLSGKSIFTSLDLASGYHQIPMAEDSKHITGFVTPDGHYEYTRMPFGLVNAPAVFQSMINKALGPKRFDLAIPYLDDLLSTASTTDEMFNKLETIFDLLRKANLTLNLKKCHFFRSKIDFLGFEISEEGLRPGSKKTIAVNEFPRPTNVHQVRQFVGLASFFRRFVYNFATIAKPLTKLTKADTVWAWGEEQETAFQSIKSKLITRPVLALYNSEYITEVHCDASKVGIGGILLQKPRSDAPLQPVAYFSRQTTREEEFWHSYELETMAVVLSLRKFRVYLIGIEFKVVTDCNALRSTLTKRDLLSKIARWWLILQEYNFTIEYRPGHSMQHVDALSRNPVLAPEQEELEVLNIQSKDWLYTVQMTDSHIKMIKNILQTSNNDLKDITTNYAVRDGKVYRKVGNKLKWVVPNSARWKICQMNHDEAGHFSVEKTLEKIASDYWFPKMNRFVKKYVTACINCAYNKELGGKKSGLLHPIPKVSAVFHTIHIDHLGPFIKSKRGNTYILGIIDAFSKFIFIKGVRNTKSKTTVKVVEEIFATFGHPKVIISDQGSSFTSNEFKNFISLIGTKHICNAVATPRANGQIERYNRTILNSLAAMNHGHDEKEWDVNLGKLQWSLNNTVNKSTGKSPAEIVFGQRTIGQSEGIIKGALDQTEQLTSAEREELRLNVQQNIEDNQTKMKVAYDKNRAPTKIFQLGDLVMIPNHNPEKGKSKKLAPKFRGPFKITQVLNNDRYEVSSVLSNANRKYQNIYPADHLKPWITIQGPFNNEASCSSDSSISE